MAIKKVKIKNFKLFNGEFTLELHSGLNILVGPNEAGKSTILEAIHVALTGLYAGRSIRGELSQYLFNKEAVERYIRSVNEGTPTAPPSVVVEIFFDGEINAEFEGNDNSEHIGTEGLCFEIAFDEKYREEYERLVERKDMRSLPIEYYEATWTTFARQTVTTRSIPRKIGVDRFFELSNCKRFGRLYFANCERLTFRRRNNFRRASSPNNEGRVF